MAEHYENRGVLRTVIEGADAVQVMTTLLREGSVTRMDHAAYLGRELALAEMALKNGGTYVQDRAPDCGPAAVPRRLGSESSGSCGCASDCGDAK